MKGETQDRMQLLYSVCAVGVRRSMRMMRAVRSLFLDRTPRQRNVSEHSLQCVPTPLVGDLRQYAAHGMSQRRTAHRHLALSEGICIQRQRQALVGADQTQREVVSSGLEA